jgi:hypothetical protein
VRNRTERALNYQDLKSVGKRRIAAIETAGSPQITAKATQLPGKVVGEKEKGRDSPPWIVAHSTHVSYPARGLYMQAVCQ